MDRTTRRRSPESEEPPEAGFGVPGRFRQCRGRGRSGRPGGESLTATQQQDAELARGLVETVHLAPEPLVLLAKALRLSARCPEPGGGLVSLTERRRQAGLALGSQGCRWAWARGPPTQSLGFSPQGIHGGTVVARPAIGATVAGQPALGHPLPQCPAREAESAGGGGGREPDIWLR